MYLIIIQAWVALFGVISREFGSQAALIPLLIVSSLWAASVFFTNVVAMKEFLRTDYLILLHIIHTTLYFILAKYNYLGVAYNHIDWNGFFSVVLPYVVYLNLRVEKFSIRIEGDLVSSSTLIISFIIGLISILLFITGNADSELGIGNEMMGVNPNNYGSLFVGILALIIPLTKKDSLSIWLFSSVYLINMLLSRSMTCIIAIIIVITIYLISKKISQLFISLLAMTIVFILTYYVLHEQIMELGFARDIMLIRDLGVSGEYEIMLTGRPVLWDAAFRYLSDASINQLVFGSGIGGFAYSLYEYSGKLLEVHPHNHALQCLLDGGLLKLSLYLALMCSVITDAWQEYKRTNTNLSKGVLLLIASFILMDLAGPRFNGRILFYILPPIAIFYNTIPSNSTMDRFMSVRVK